MNTAEKIQQIDQSEKDLFINEIIDIFTQLDINTNADLPQSQIDLHRLFNSIEQFSMAFGIGKHFQE